MYVANQTDKQSHGRDTNEYARRSIYDYVSV